MNNTFYDKLGVPSDASAEEITNAYEALKRTGKDDKDVVGAWRVLNNPTTRATYDRGLASLGGFGGGPTVGAASATPVVAVPVLSKPGAKDAPGSVKVGSATVADLHRDRQQRMTKGVNRGYGKYVVSGMLVVFLLTQVAVFMQYSSSNQSPYDEIPSLVDAAVTMKATAVLGPFGDVKVGECVMDVGELRLGGGNSGTIAALLAAPCDLKGTRSVVDKVSETTMCPATTTLFALSGARDVLCIGSDSNTAVFPDGHTGCVLETPSTDPATGEQTYRPSECAVGTLTVVKTVKPNQKCPKAVDAVAISREGYVCLARYKSKEGG